MIPKIWIARWLSRLWFLTQALIWPHQTCLGFVWEVPGKCLGLKRKIIKSDRGLLWARSPKEDLRSREHGRGPRFVLDLSGTCLGSVWAPNAKFQNLTLGGSGLAKGRFGEPRSRTRPRICLGCVWELFGKCLASNTIFFKT